MKRNPLVSVVIPTLNEERFLGQCLETIKNQTYKNVEIIVVDNGSADKTVAIAKKHGARAYQAGPERAGQVNFGVKKAKGKYCYRVDGDFILEPEVVEQCVEKCEGEKLIKLWPPVQDGKKSAVLMPVFSDRKIMIFIIDFWRRVFATVELKL